MVPARQLAGLWAPLLLAACATTGPAPAKADAIATANRLVKVGDSSAQAIARLTRAGFSCRRLQPHEFASFHPAPVTMTSCHIEASKTADGYLLVYANLAIDRQGRVVESNADWYPVIYRNLRKDAEGRTIVVRDGQ